MDMQPADHPARPDSGAIVQHGELSTGTVLQRDAAECEPIRARVIPMVADALHRTPLLGVQLIGWDCVMVPMANAMLLGVAIAIRGIDLTGPQKELMQFRAFSTWKPSQDEVDQMVGAIIGALREARAQQSMTVNGQ